MPESKAPDFFAALAFKMRKESPTLSTQFKAPPRPQALGHKRAAQSSQRKAIAKHQPLGHGLHSIAQMMRKPPALPDDPMGQQLAVRIVPSDAQVVPDAQDVVQRLSFGQGPHVLQVSVGEPSGRSAHRPGAPR